MMERFIALFGPFGVMTIKPSSFNPSAGWLLEVGSLLGGADRWETLYPRIDGTVLEQAAQAGHK